MFIKFKEFYAKIIHTNIFNSKFPELQYLFLKQVTVNYKTTNPLQLENTVHQYYYVNTT